MSFAGKGGRPVRVVRTLGAWIAVGFAMGCVAAATDAADGQSVTAASVQRAIDRGVAYLRKSQTERGGWVEWTNQSCGKSALCTLAMLNAGVPRDDPDMVRALAYLRTFKPKETYSVALQTLVFCHLYNARDLASIHENVAWLIRNQNKEGHPQVGGWGYTELRSGGDPSNTQFALLALGAAQDRGIAVDSQVFARSLHYWEKRQSRDGGWAYNIGRRNSGSMTCAGIASITICNGQIGDGSSRIENQQIRCCGEQDDANDPIEDGLDWLARNFTLQVNPGGEEISFFYYMYALERVGRLSGRRFIGEHDWYREGAERLLGLQDDFQGFWVGAGRTFEPPDVATSFALLFLSKGKRQVVAGRLKYGAQNQWQQHPDSLRQLVRHVERDWRRDLTWQTISADTAQLDDLLQTPVLVVSGQRALNWGPGLQTRMRQYVEQGGCILFEADGGDGCGDATAFESSVRTMTASWFEGARLDRLPPSHPIWFAEHRADPTALGEDFWVYGIQACCRTAVFYVPKSLSCRWELSENLVGPGQQDREISSAVRDQIANAVRIGENLIAYATGRELKDKLEGRIVLDGKPPESTPRGSSQLAMLALDAGGDEARRALPNAVALIASQLPIELVAAENLVDLDAEELVDVQYLWIHGRTEFSLSSSDRTTLKEFVDNGGMIIGTAICGNQAFAESFRREIKLIFPQAPLRPIPSDHPLLTAYGGFDLRQVTIRTPEADGGGVRRRLGPPELELAVVDNVAGVFFSPLDLSCALESSNSVQCPGYSTEEAAKIVANLVLFGLNQ